MALLQSYIERLRGSQLRTAEDVTDSVTRFVSECNPEASEIREYLHEAVRIYGEHCRAEGVEEGRDKERSTHPAIRSFGGALADAMKRQRNADHALALDVFHSLTERGSNPFAAFYSAIEALTGMKPEAKR